MPFFLNQPVFVSFKLSRALAIWAILLIILQPSRFINAQDTISIPVEVLQDKIRGGLLGQMLGNLNGLKHEMKYIERPGEVEGYVPSLPDGAWTDDDTDFEWVYIMEMQRLGRVMLEPETIADLWRGRINQRIWCSNQYARQLMDIGMIPPLTGRTEFNPWAEFNISGQFLCETFGLIAPGMPQTASRIGLHYTTVAIDGEPAQTTQFFDSIIALAFFENDVLSLLSQANAAVDPNSEIHKILHDVTRIYRDMPGDWKAARELIKNKYSKHNGGMRDRNGYELNTASTLAALLYGEGDFSKTLETAFNFGWDCDNSAATAGTILGTIKGYKWMMSQGWTIVDRYRNETRDQMPMDETITSFADRLLDLAERVILEKGGERRRDESGALVFVVPGESPRNVYPSSRTPIAAEMQVINDAHLIQTGLESQDQRLLARAAYMGICLGKADGMKTSHPVEWERALNALNQFDQIAQVLYHHSPVPAAGPLRDKASKAGMLRPEKKRNLW